MILKVNVIITFIKIISQKNSKDKYFVCFLLDIWLFKVK